MRLPTALDPVYCWSPVQRESIQGAYALLWLCFCPGASIPSQYTRGSAAPTRAPRPDQALLKPKQHDGTVFGFPQNHLLLCRRILFDIM